MPSSPGHDIPLLNVAEAAKRMRVTTRTIHRWLTHKDHPLPFIPNGTEKLIRLDHLMQKKEREFQKKRSSRVVRVLLDSMSYKP